MEHNIGFVGLGAMGYAMAMNVRKHMDGSATLYVYDVFQPSSNGFKAECSKFGPIEITGSAKEVAENASTIVSIVPTANNVTQVYLDEATGIIAARDEENKNLDKDRLYLECSTIDVATTKKVGAALQEAGMGTYIDCPVSGGVPAAGKGTLSLLLGMAEPETIAHEPASAVLLKRIQSICEYIGDPEKIFHCGALGNGLAAKICNNYLSCTILLANCEAYATGMHLGLDKHLLHKIIQSSSGQNFMADQVCPVPGVVPHAPSSNNYKLGFKTQMLSKDVSLGIDAAKGVGIAPTIGEAAISVFDKASLDERCIDRDGSAVYKFLGGPEI